MFQTRMHRRRHQCAATGAATLLATTFTEGHYARALSACGPDQPGVPAISFRCIDDKEFRLSEPVSKSVGSSLDKGFLSTPDEKNVSAAMPACAMSQKLPPGGHG